MEDLRSELYKSCQLFINSRISTAETALVQAREAANDDTKSSAGDKFETTREMMQQELDRNKRLLMDAKEQQYLLSLVENFIPQSIVAHGSIVDTSNGIFYVSISVGQILVNEKKYYAVSPTSPIGKLMLGKKNGERFELNNLEYVINNIL